MDFFQQIQAEAEKLGIELTRGREKGEWVVVSNGDGIQICSPAHSSYPRGQTWQCRNKTEVFRLVRQIVAGTARSPDKTR